jgi:hypothetical protein
MMSQGRGRFSDTARGVARSPDERSDIRVWE